jgi:acetyl esterase/lipase
MMAATTVAAKECLPLVPRNPDGNLIVAGSLGDIEYAPGLALDAYVQPGPGTRPLVVVVHGGGFTSGSRVAFVGQLLETLTAAGFNWVSVDYRLHGEAGWRGAVEDVEAAVAFVRCHAADLHADPARLALVGEDVGATIAAHVSAADPKIRAVALIGGVFEGPSDAALGGSGGVKVRPAAPAFVVHGGEDDEVPAREAERWCAGVRAAGGGCEPLIVDRAIHRPENWWPSQWAYKARLIDWLQRTLGGVTPAPAMGPGTAAAKTASVSRFSSGLTKNIVYDSVNHLALDAWLPREPGSGAAVILVHGGGWEAGDKVTYITPLFEPLARAGLAWFSIDYRLTPAVSNREQIEDLRHAVRFVRQNAARFRIDSRRIFLVGESASGQMVSLLASEDRDLAGIVSFYGVYDFLPWFTSLTPRSIPVRLFGLTSMDEEATAVLKRYSPLYQVRADMAPLLLVHGTAEELWDQAQAMTARLDQVGARHELYAVQGAPHGMENWEGHPVWEGYKEKVIGWIRQTADGRRKTEDGIDD